MIGINAYCICVDRDTGLSNASDSILCIGAEVGIATCLVAYIRTFFSAGAGIVITAGGAVSQIVPVVVVNFVP